MRSNTTPSPGPDNKVGRELPRPAKSIEAIPKDHRCDTPPSDAAALFGDDPDLTPPTMAEVRKILANTRFRFTDETTLQEGIAQALSNAGIAFTREHYLSPGDRLDFLLPGGLAIEVKIKGTLQDLLRQVARYAAKTQVNSILAIGTPRWLTHVPETIAGKPLESVWLLASLL